MTRFSFLFGTLSPAELCALAARAGIAHLGVCDWGGLYAHPEFAQAAARAGLHAVFGVELGLGAARLFAFARGERGYRALCRLVGRWRAGEGGPGMGADGRAADGEGGGVRFLADCAAACAEDLWLLSDHEGLLRALAARLGTADLRVALPPLWLGPGRAARPEEDAEPGARKVPDPAPPPDRRRLLAFARAAGLRVAALPWVVHGGARGRAVHRLAVAVKNGRLLAELPARETAWKGCGFLGAAALRRAYADRPEALAEARRLAEACTLSLAEPRPLVLPSMVGEDGGAEEREARAFAVLRARAEAGLARRAFALERAGRLAAARARLRAELEVIGKLRLAGYFLVVDEIVALARAHGIPCLGRGSAADSLVAHCLGFTDADPLRYGLVFERFLNPLRFAAAAVGGPRALPDIDLDFCWRRRDELLALVAERFGKERFALLATHPEFGFRAAWREAARAFGLGPAEVDRRARKLPRRPPAERRAPPERAAGGPRARARDARIWNAALALAGLRPCLGLHPGGTVLTPGPVAEHAPVETSAKGLPCVQWDKRGAPFMGLVKIDLLGNRGLTMWGDARRELLRLGPAAGGALDELEAGDPAAGAAGALGPEPPEEDPKAAALLAEGRTIGCWQIESPGMRSLLVRMRARTMTDTIRALALIRPGPAGSGMLDRFVRRARGREPEPALPPAAAALLAESHGVMLYEEDVIQMLAALTGLDLADADLLRRRIAKGDPEAERALLDAARARGAPRALAADFLAQVRRFAAFAFNKAHATTYGRLAWRLLRLKARAPAALFAAILASETGYYPPPVYVEEAKRRGIAALAPCVNRSGRTWRTELLPGAPRPALRAGLTQLRGLPARFADALLAERDAGGPFFAVGEFCERLARRGAPPQDDWVEDLILAGAFDQFEGTRPEKLWRFRIEGRKRRAAALGGEATGALFPEALQPPRPVLPCLPEFPPAERRRLEARLLGFTTGAHPIAELRAAHPGPPLAELPARIGREVEVRAWLSTTRRHRGRSGRPMCFLTIEDETAVAEAVLFPPAYARHAAALRGPGRYRLRGLVRCRDGAVSLDLSYLAPDDDPDTPNPRSKSINLPFDMPGPGPFRASSPDLSDPPGFL